MLEHNKKMVDFLKFNGIEANVKYIDKGSLKGCWAISGKNEDLNASVWWNSPELWAKLNSLGFSGYDGRPLDQLSGNGGTFSIFARYKEKSLLESVLAKDTKAQDEWVKKAESGQVMRIM
jgi:hypothetical protein